MFDLDRNNLKLPRTESLSSCPVCHGKDDEFLFWCYDRYYQLPGKFGLVKCMSCGLARLSPRPLVDEIGFYYPNSQYYSYSLPGEFTDRGILNRLRARIRETVLNREFGYPISQKIPTWTPIDFVLARLFVKRGSFGLGKRLPHFVPNGRALDIGCGNGSYLNILKKIGWEVSGVDISSTAASTAMKSFGIDVFVGDVADAKFSFESFDYIHMSHSIEHLGDPLKTLKSVSKLLRKNGILYIETPNLESAGFRRFGQFWMPLETPRHLFLFSPRSMAATLKLAGLDVISLTSTHMNFDGLSKRFVEENFLGRTSDYSRNTQAIDSWSPSRWQRLSTAIKNLRENLDGDFLHCWVTKS